MAIFSFDLIPNTANDLQNTVMSDSQAQNQG